MSFQEQIKAFEKKLNEATARMADIMKAASDEGRTLDDIESSEYDGIATEKKHIEAHLVRLRDLAGEGAQGGQPANGKTKSPTILVKRQDPADAFPGQSFVRRVIAKALSQLGGYEQTAAQIAQDRWGKTHPMLVAVIKAGVAGGSAYGDGTDSWGMELVSADSRYTGDFLEFLKSKTVYDQLPLREVPANLLIKGQEAISTGYWVGESVGIPVSAQEFIDVELKPRKVAAISVVSMELLRYASPSAEMLVRDGLVEAIRQRIDTTFLGTGGANVSTPAGILNANADAGGSAGTDADGLRADIRTLYGAFLAAKNASDLRFVMTPTMAKSIALLRNALGQREFPEITAMGGILEGDQVVTGDNVGATHLILLKPSEIWKIGDLGVEVALSRDATIEQDDDPTGEAEGPTAASRNLVSMFQTDNVAFRVIRTINFVKRRLHAARYINDAVYDESGT